MSPFFRTSFRNFFWTAQLCAGMAMAIRSAIEGANGGFWYAALFGIAGFFAAMPITAGFAALLAMAPQSFFSDRIRWARTIVAGLVSAMAFIALLMLLDHWR